MDQERDFLHAIATPLANIYLSADLAMTYLKKDQERPHSQVLSRRVEVILQEVKKLREMIESRREKIRQ